ncbi:NAD(P)H-dependent oxidoreductase [Streptomyces mirabilis]|uniref:NAD(P)H-dependent oxidoreductase n=1 Tax=Streptomyces mirabilis TaxID=68239 RepID=UPI0036810F6D
MPSVFKAWLDQIIVDGRTLNYGGEGAALGRPAVLISARGGRYRPGALNKGKDFLVPSLETALGETTILGLDAPRPPRS